MRTDLKHWRKYKDKMWGQYYHYIFIKRGKHVFKIYRDWYIEDFKKNIQVMLLILTGIVVIIFSQADITAGKSYDIMINIATEISGIIIAVFLVQILWNKYHKKYQKGKRQVERWSKQKHNRYLIRRRRKMYIGIR